jgi:hypothetical protein
MGCGASSTKDQPEEKKDAPVEAPKEAPKEAAKEAPKKAAKEAPKEAAEEAAEEAPKDQAEEKGQVPAEALQAATEAVPKDWEKVICPFISALYKNGEMKLDADGNVTVPEAKQAFERAGIPAQFMGKIFPADKFLGQDDTINIFSMDGSKFEHATSTGMRDPLPDPEKWEEFAAFAKDDEFGVPEIVEACKHFDKTEHSNDVHEDNHGSAMAVFPLFLQVFTGFVEGAKMSVATLRALVMESVFPEGFAMKPRAD